MVSTTNHRRALLRNIARSGFAALLLTFSASIASHAQQPVPANPARITQQIDNSVVTTLKGNVHPLARPQNDLGAAPASEPMGHMQFVLHRSAAQEAALESYMASLQVKGSPNYHKWLTPQQFGKLYGPSDADIQKLTGWLEGQGFAVNRVANGRTNIDFSGSVVQVQSAFHTSIHLYRANGISFYANTADPQIPSAISAVVSGITRLNDVPLKSNLARGKMGKFDNQTHRFSPLTTARALNPQYTVGDSTNGFTLFVVPADAATIYNTPNSTFNANFGSGSSYTGMGVTIGIAGQSAIDPTLVQNYRTLFVGDNKSPVISNLDDVGDVTGDDQESYLDNEIAGGLAPGANIHFYTAQAADGGVIASAEYAIDQDNTIDILSMSYGSCELSNTNAGNSEINQDWQQAAAQGITVVVSTGDNGPVSCDQTQLSDGSNNPTASGPLAVNGLASTPYNIAVGGTDYDVLLNNFNQYVDTSSPGSPTNFYRTATGYIPEATWNNSPYPNTTVDQNVPLSVYTGNPDDDSIVAASGGRSNCSLNTTTNSATGTCTSGYAKPSWQTGTGVPNDLARDIPDVALLAGNGLYGALWTVCDGSTQGNDNDYNTGTADCVADSSGNFFVDGIGGTSAATPAFAGILALVVQKTGQRQGQAAPILYSLFNSTPSVFHDVTVGNNSVGCAPNAATVANCLQNSAGYYFESGFDTNAGYDLATGLGSVDATALVTNWNSASGSLYVASVTATPSSTTITTADPLTFTISVASIVSGGPTPAGSVVVTDGVYTSPATVLTAGAASITIPANSLTTTGDDTFSINFTPEAGSSFATASGFSVVTINSSNPTTGSFTLTSTAVTVAAGATTGNASTITITPNKYVGTVNLACSLTTPATGANASYYPACALSASSVKITSTSAGTATATFSSTTRATSELAYPKTNRLLGAGGGAVLACILFLGIPARRRGWRSMLGLLFLVTLAGVGCGGGSSSSNQVTTGTTAGVYTFTVTGTDSVTATVTSTATITVTVN